MESLLPRLRAARQAFPALPRLLPAQRVVRIAPMRWFIAALIVQALLHVWLPGPVLIQSPWNFVGLALMAAALRIALLAEAEFVWNATPVRPFESPRALVTTGPYRWSRNPMYLSFLLGLAGLALVFGTSTPWLALPLLAWVLGRGFVHTEEGILAAHFGHAYARYRATVRRWL